MREGLGERAEQARKRRHWTIIGVIAAAGLPIGFILGTAMARHEQGVGDVFASFPTVLVAAIVGLGLIGFLWGSWLFFKEVDEVELVDNLWGSTAGFYAYATLFPTWWVLAEAGFAPQPHHWLIFILSLVAGMAVYGYRKWRAR